MASVAGEIIESFEVYGTGADSRAFMLQGAFAELIGFTAGVECSPPSWDDTGDNALQVSVSSGSDGTGARRVLDAPYAEVMTRFRAGAEALPAANGVQALFTWRDDTNASICSLRINTTGTLSLTDGEPNGTVLGTTAGVVFVAGKWQFFEAYLKRHASAGVFTLYGEDPDLPLLELTGLAFGTGNIAQFVALRARASASSFGEAYMRDLIVRKVDVADTPVWWGNTAIATSYPNADTDEDGWTAYPRKKLGVGILDTRANTNAAVSAAQATPLDLGSGDFTIETFVRFMVLPTGSNYAAILGKWTASGNARSYQLLKCGPSLNDGALVWRISTDGMAGTIVNVIAWPWEPETNVWHYLTIERVSGETTLYIDGVRQGVASADAATYAAVSTALGISGEMNGSSAVLANTHLDGFADELRMTIGDYRYDGDFTPPAVPFPRDVGGDPLFASVQLLAGWDNGIVDESLTGRTLTARNGAVQETPDDGDFAFQVLNDSPPRDDTFIQAALTRATDDLALFANAANTNTVTLGSDTYTFKAALTTAYDVLIGATAEDSIDNLIAAINADPGEGTLYGTGTVANADAYAEGLPGAVLRASAIAAGTAGNAIVATSVLADGGWQTATLEGGADIPSASAFRFRRLPFDATVVKAVCIAMRSYKTEAGDCSIQPSFVGPLGAATTGTDAAQGTSPAYYFNCFETDPDTAGGLTPSTIAGARIRLNRTV